MKKLILILVLTVSLPFLGKSQALNKVEDPECFEYYQPCTECLENADKWHTANSNTAKPNNTSQARNQLNNTTLTDTKKKFINKTVTILGRPVRIVTAMVGSVIMAIIISKTLNLTNAITTQ